MKRSLYVLLPVLVVATIAFQNCGPQASISGDAGSVHQVSTSGGTLATVRLTRNDPIQQFTLDLTVDLHPVPPNAGAYPQANLRGSVTRHIGGPSGPDCTVSFNNEPFEQIRPYADGISFQHQSVVCAIAVIAGQSVDVQATFQNGQTDNGVYATGATCAYGDQAKLPLAFVRTLTNYILAKNSSNCIPADPLLPLPICPIPPCAAPPAGCQYVASTTLDANGCPVGCGQLMCATP